MRGGGVALALPRQAQPAPQLPSCPWGQRWAKGGEDSPGSWGLTSPPPPTSWKTKEAPQGVGRMGMRSPSLELCVPAPLPRLPNPGARENKQLLPPK